MAFFDVTAKNEEQKVALQYLNNDKPFTFITGAAGTGKNILTQAVGLEKVVNTQDFKKLIYTRLQVQLGQHLGYLTGDIDGKTEPFVLPFIDNLDKMDNSETKNIKRALLGGNKDEKGRKVFFDSIQTLRGRSVNDSYFICDESQNMDCHTIKAVGTRIDDNSKFVFVGNFAQIDEKSLRTPSKNGLYQMLKGMYDFDPNQEYFDHIHLTEVHRDPVVNVVEQIFSTEKDIHEDFTELELRGSLEELKKIK